MSRKHRLQIALIGSYFGVWFVFGVLYKYIADSSSGDAFIFQEDLKQRSQALAFARAIGVAVPERLIRDLLKINHERLMLNLKGMLEEPGPVTNEPIGREWALFYEEKLKQTGITHFRLLELPREVFPLGDLLSDDSVFVIASTAFSKRPIMSHEVKPYLLELYRGPIGLLPTEEEQLIKYTLTKKSAIWSARPPFKLFPNIFLQPIDMFSQDAINFFTFLDEDPHVLNKISSGVFSYPLLDFLYFSAITIGTVGYGDILPNRTDVRVLVMIETLLGITLAGAFVSSLFMEKAV